MAKPTKKKAPAKATKKSKPAPRKPAPAKRTAAKPTQPEAAPKPSRMAQAIAQREHDADRRPSLERPEPAHQLGLPDIDQVRDSVMERHYVELEEAKAARKAAQARIHEVEAAIQVRFDHFAEQDPDDPRAQLYIVANGAPLKPTTVHKISCGRPPAKPKKALDDAKRQAVEGEPDPDLPDHGDG